MNHHWYYRWSVINNMITINYHFHGQHNEMFHFNRWMKECRNEWKSDFHPSSSLLGCCNIPITDLIYESNHKSNPIQMNDFFKYCKYLIQTSGKKPVANKDWIIFSDSLHFIDFVHFRKQNDEGSSLYKIYKWKGEKSYYE